MPLKRAAADSLASILAKTARENKVRISHLTASQTETIGTRKHDYARSQSDGRFCTRGRGRQLCRGGAPDELVPFCRQQSRGQARKESRCAVDQSNHAA